MAWFLRIRKNEAEGGEGGGPPGRGEGQKIP
jgi:hypothetical protein